jgi:hypothetical protein
VAYEIPPISDADGDGNVEECFEDINPAVIWGDNHCGYIGFRQPSAGSLIDDGAMNVVVRDWTKP